MGGSVLKIGSWGVIDFLCTDIEFSWYFEDMTIGLIIFVDEYLYGDLYDPLYHKLKGNF